MSQVVSLNAFRDQRSQHLQTSFDVVLVDCGFNKTEVIFVICDITNLGLADAFELVRRTPSIIKKQVSRHRAELAMQALTAAGAGAVLR